MERNELVVCIVNHGFTDLVMESARKAGARGGTVLTGRGTGNKEMEKLFGVAITPEKEMVLIIIPASIRDAVLKEINVGAGMETPGQGIAFSLPVSDVVGLSSPMAEDALKEDNAQAPSEGENQANDGE